MGRLYLCQLDGRIYSCKFCHCHLANSDQLVSKDFHCKHGKAYLFKTVVNVSEGPQEERHMTTGLHTVSDIYCNCCRQNVGWKYEVAHDKTQKYKEGKFILERGKVVDGDGSSIDYYLDAHPVGSDADDV